VIDLHCHYLPGVDDGAQTLTDSLQLAVAAVAAGIKTAVMTPHLYPGRYDNKLPHVRHLCEQFQRVLQHRDIPLEIRPGAEVRITPEVMPMVDAGEIPFLGTMNGYHILLLEFPHGNLIAGAEKLIAWLLKRGIRAMIAHPERNKDVMRNVTKIGPYVDMGCLLQLTGASLIGAFGKAVQDCALEIIRRRWADVVATDAHDIAKRPPCLDVAYQELVRLRGERYARELTQDTPSRILAGI
jgi:protein-tyrosine phosphatase